MAQSDTVRQSMREPRGKCQCGLHSECYVSPHPGPLPWGEEDVPLPFSRTRRRVCPTNLPSNRTYGGLFPLPVGEGQGEGNQVAARCSNSDQSRNCRTQRVRQSAKRLSVLDRAADIYTIIGALFVSLSFFSFFLITRLKQPPATHETTT